MMQIVQTVQQKLMLILNLVMLMMALMSVKATQILKKAAQKASPIANVIVVMMKGTIVVTLHLLDQLSEILVRIMIIHLFRVHFL